MSNARLNCKVLEAQARFGEAFLHSLTSLRCCSCSPWAEGWREGQTWADPPQPLQRTGARGELG